MKIVVIGGTGLIGSKVVSKLTQRGHEALAAAPNTGVNTITGRIPLLCCPTWGWRFRLRERPVHRRGDAISLAARTGARILSV